MGRQFTSGEASPCYGSSKVAICALRTLQARLEQLESERERAFEKSIDVHQIAAKEIEDMKASYEVKLNRYKVHQEVLQKKIESMNAAHNDVEKNLEQSKNESNELRKQLTDALAERDEVAESLKRAKAEAISMSNENKQMRHLISSGKQQSIVIKETSRHSLKNSKEGRKTKVRPERRLTVSDRLCLAYSDQKVPFLTNVAKETHNLTANVQNALSSNCSTSSESPNEDQQRSMLKASIETMTDSVTNLMKSLSQEPSVKAYQQMAQLLSKIETARRQITEIKRRQRQRQGSITTRTTSPDSRRCYERKLRMLSILRKFKSELFGVNDKQP